MSHPIILRRLRPLALAILPLLTPAYAQETSAPAGMKVILAPPAAAAWTVTYSYAKSRENVLKDASADLAAGAIDPGDLDRPSKIRFAIRQPFAEMALTYEGGGGDRAYYHRNYEFKKSSRGEEILVSDLDSYPTVLQLFRTKLPGVHWVAPEHFVRIEDAHGERCALFSDDAESAPPPGQMDAVIDSSKYQDRQAWFSIETGLPVAFTSGDATGKFNFEPAPTDNIAIPAAIRAKMTEIIKYQTYLEQRKAAETTNP